MGSGLAMGKLSLGRVVSETFGIFGRNLVPIAGIAFAVSVVTVVLTQSISAVVVQTATVDGRVGTAGFRNVFIAAMVSLVIAIAVRTIATGAITHIAASDQVGQRVAFGPALATGLRLALPLLGLGVVVGIGVGLGSILLVVPGLMLAIRWLVAVPARVVECPSMGSSLSRSAALTKGSFWRLFGLVVILVVFSLAVEAAVALLGGTAGSVLVVGILQVIASTATTSLSATGAAVCYMELRRIREGATPGADGGGVRLSQATRALPNAATIDGRLSMGRVVSVTVRVIGRNIVGIAVMCVLATLISEIPSVLALLGVSSDAQA